MSNKKLDRALRRSNKKKEDKVIMLSGQLGIPLSGQKLVEVPNRQGFVFVRLKNNTSELIQAYNNAVSPIYDLPVLVARQTNGYRVMGRNIDRYTNQWGQAPYLPKHGTQHSFNPDLNIGGDIVWVYSQQFMPLLAYPSGSNGSPQLSVSPYFIRDMSGAWKYVGNTGTPDTTPYNPTTGSRAVVGLVYLDTVSGNPQLLINSGTYIVASLTGSNQIVDYIPRVTNPNWIPLAGIRLVSGSTQLSWNNVYDVRPFLQVFPTGTSSGGGGGGVGGLGFVGWDEGIYQATGTILNVTGQRLTLTASGTVLNLNASPDPQELIGVYGLSNGTPLGTGTWVDFGNNLTATISGTTIRVDAANSGGGGSIIGVMAQDEGIPLGTGTTMNFVGLGVTASISGSVVNVNIPSSGRYLIQQQQPWGTGTVSFQSIPQFYNELQMEYMVRSTRAGQTSDPMSLFLNNDKTTTSYRTTAVRSANGASNNFGQADSNYSDPPAASSPSGSHSMGIVKIPYYSQSIFNKQLIIEHTDRRDNSSVFELRSAVGMEWGNNATVNRIDFVLTNGNYATGSIFTLYGLY